MTDAHFIDPSQFLADQLAEASPDLLRSMLATFMQSLMGADADVQCNADYGQRSPERTNSRNGYRPRQLDTRAGTIELAVPKLRSGTYFPDWLLEPRKRAEKALTSVVATCYLLGVSTRRMDKLVQSLGISGLSRSQVSVMAKDLDGQVAAFRNRRLDQGPYTFVAADALVLKVREGGRVARVHALVATGVNADGYREVLGIDVTTSEDGAGWLQFFRGLTARGLTGVKLVTADAHAGLVAAIGATLPGASWQRCRTHYAVNLMAQTPKASWPGVRALLHSVYDQPDAKAVDAQYDRVLQTLGEKLPKVAAHLEEAPIGSHRVHRVSEGDLAADLVQQPAGEVEQGDPAAHRRRRDLPRPRLLDPPRRCGPGRTTRRMGRRTPLPRPGRHDPRPRRRRTRTREGGDHRIHPAGHHSLTRNHR